MLLEQLRVDEEHVGLGRDAESGDVEQTEARRLDGRAILGERGLAFVERRAPLAVLCVDGLDLEEENVLHQPAEAAEDTQVATWVTFVGSMRLRELQSEDE